MRIPSLQIGVLTALLANCAPGVQSIPPSQGPVTTDAKAPANMPATEPRRLAPGLYRYRLVESTHVQLQELGDTLPGIVQTDALVSVRITPSDGFSRFTALVSIDSIRIRQNSPVPSTSMVPAARIDSILRVIFSPGNNVAEVLLPDSLCAYSQFVTIADDLLLPRIPSEFVMPTNVLYSDTVTVHGCQGGAVVETVSIRKLSNPEQTPTQLALQRQSIIRGAGSIRRDSLSITGSVSTMGTVTFQAGQRLPLNVRTRSDGMLTVQLGTQLSVFRQTSTRELSRDSTTPPN